VHHQQIHDVNISNALETFTQTFQCVQAAQPSPHKAALESPKQLHTTSNTRHQYFLTRWKVLHMKIHVQENQYFLTRWKNGIQKQEL
jgi:hypothetical protein